MTANWYTILSGFLFGLGFFLASGALKLIAWFISYAASGQDAGFLH